MEYMITERQSEILNSIVQEYINLAEPVGSQLLEKKHKFGLSPATIRNEMQELTDAGFLYQPHTSSGRVPTDKGYRFFVDELIDRFPKSIEILMDFGNQKFENPFEFIRDITKFLAKESSNLALGYSSGQKVVWKEGWREIFQEPEFSQTEFTSEFTRMLDDFEKNIESFFFDLPSKIQVYIGRENPFSKTRQFSIIAAKCHFPKKQKGVLTILGPKRMAYDRNIKLLESITRALEEY